MPRRVKRPGMLAGGDGSTLSLDFTAMSGLDSRFTFTRASTGTYINSAGLVTTMAAASTNDPTKARFDHDPTTLAPRGLLIEASATNELQRSNEFNTSPWYTSNFNTPTIASPAVTDPAGGTNTWYCVPSGVGSVIHGFRYNTTFTAVNYTFSIWAKAAQHDKFVISDASSGQGACRFDLTAKTANVITGIVTPTNPQIIEYPNGWFRCSFTMVMAASTRGMTYSSYPTGASIGAFGATFTATGIDGMYFYGAQTELASFASSYIPTGSSTVQRAADSCSMTGTNFSSWFNSTEGTFVATFQTTYSGTTDSTAFVLSLDSSGSKRIMYLQNGTQTVGSYDGTTIVTALGDATGVVAKTASAYTQSERAIVLNNGTVITGSVVAGYSSGTSLSIGTLGIFATYRSIKFFPTRLPDATLQSLTQ